MRIALFAFLISASLSIGGYILYNSQASEEQKSAASMVERVVNLYAQSGPEQTFDAINISKVGFRNGTIYPFVIDKEGKVVAHPSPKIRGTIARDGKRIKGRQIFNKIASVVKSKGKGWIGYEFPHPGDGKLTAKVTYVAPLGKDYFVGAGYYVR